MSKIDNVTWSFPLFNPFIYFTSWFAKKAWGPEGTLFLVRVPCLDFVSLA